MIAAPTEGDVAAAYPELRALHRFMTTPLDAEGVTPAALLGAGNATTVAALIHGGRASG